MRFCSPPRENLKLSSTEKSLFDLLDEKLDYEWEFYFKPHLNGISPSLVVLHRNRGLAIFKISKVDLTNERYELGQSITKDFKNKKDKTLYFLREIGLRNPIRDLWETHDCVTDLFCPRMSTRAGFAVISCGLIFASNTQHEIQDRIGKLIKQTCKSQSKFPISGKDNLKAKDINKIFPKHNRNAWFIDPKYYHDLRSWLLEPNLSKSEREEVPLDHSQSKIVDSNETTKSKMKRIRGPAGSGKTLVIACRAAKLLAEGKNVLIVTYNITLINYIRRLVTRAIKYNEGFDHQCNAKGKLEIKNFHLFQKELVSKLGFEKEYSEIWNQYFKRKSNASSYQNNSNLDTFESEEEIHEEIDYSFIAEELPKAIINILCSISEKELRNATNYDSILVDEGQDFNPRWWDILRKCSGGISEMWLVADYAQDLYQESTRWTDEQMTNSGFSGKWTEFNKIYRIPNDFIKHVNYFAENFLPNNRLGIKNPTFEGKESFDQFHTIIKWVQVNAIYQKGLLTDKSSDFCVNLCCEEFVEMFKSNIDIRTSDLVFLSPRLMFGKQVVELLNSKFKYNIANTYSSEKSVNRKEKQKFFQMDKESFVMRATTLHSFKGYEATDVIIFTDDHKNQANETMLYIGLTRLLRTISPRISVICANNKLKEYGKTWGTSYQEVNM